jgi:hypothetical protein
VVEKPADSRTELADCRLKGDQTRHSRSQSHCIAAVRGSTRFAVSPRFYEAA